MSDFKINADVDLNSAEAEAKLNALTKEKRTVKIDVEVNQDSTKKLISNIEKGLSSTKIDTSSIANQLANSFNISDSKTINKLKSQMNSMVSSLAKTWNGKDFDFAKADGFYKGLNGLEQAVTKNAKVIKSSSGIYDNFFNYFKDKKIYVSDELKKAMGGDAYKELLQNNVGKIVRDATKGVSIDSIWGEMTTLFPEHFATDITTQADQITHAFNLMKQARADMTQSFSVNDLKGADFTAMSDSIAQEVLSSATKMKDALQTNIMSATEANKSTIQLDVEVNTEKIASDIRSAIQNAGTESGEAINIDLKINEEEIVSKLRSSINQLSTGDEPVKVDLKINEESLKSNLTAALTDVDIPVNFKVDAEEIESQIRSAIESIKDVNIDVHVNADTLRDSVGSALDTTTQTGQEISVPNIDRSGLTYMQDALNNVNAAGQRSQGIFSSLGSSFREAFSAYSLANLMQDGLYKVTDAGKEALSTVREFNDLETDLSMATGESRSYARELMQSYNDLGQELGSVTSDVAKSADSWLRQGRSMSETNQLIKDSMVLSKDAQMSSEDASEVLTATLNGFQMNADQASKVNDILTSIDLESASDAGGIGSALTKVASQANNAGVSLEKTAAMIATVKDVTQANDETIGNAMKSILARMNNIKAGKFVDDNGEALNDVEKVLNKIGISMRDNNDQFLDSETILDTVADKWETFDKKTQKAVSTALGGTYQANSITAMLDNWDKVERLTEVAYNSEGTAQKKFEDNYLTSLEAKTNALKASLENLATTTVSSDLYSGFLDGSKAVADFAANTNLLQSALAGLGTAGGIYAFKQLIDMFKEFSDFSKALDLSKISDMSENSFSNLMNLSKGLSEAQTKLLLSSSALSEAQRTAILMSQGMTEGQAQAAVAAMGLSAAEGTAAASTFSLSGALSGLWATLMANPLILVAAGVTAVVSVFSAYQHAVEEAVSSAKQAGTEWEENNSSIQDNISRITELREALASGTLTEQEAASAKSELLSIQESLSDSYGSQVAGIDLINGSLTEQIALLDQVSQKQAEQFQNENKKGIDKATKEIEKKRHTYAGRFYDDGSDEAETIKASVKKLQDIYGDEVVKLDKSADGITTDIHINADASQAIEVFNDFMNEISDVQKTYGESDMTNLMLDNASVGLTSAKDVLDEYQDLYNQAQKAKLVAEDDLYKAPSGEEQTAVKWLNDYANAIEKYNDALSNGDTDAIKEASTEFDAVDNAVQSLLKNSGMSEFADQFTEVRDQLNESAISVNKFNEALSGNDSSKFGKEVKKNADALKELELTDTDFKYAFETDGIQAGEDQINSLVDSALECGLISDTSSEQVSKLVNVLSSLGIISSSTGETVDTTTEAVSGLEGQVTDAQNAYNNLSTAISESMSDTGLTADSISNIKSDLQSVIDSSDELKDFDLNSLFTNTAKGVKLNNDKLEDMLELQHDLCSKDFADSINKQNDEIKEQEKALKELSEGTDEYTTAQEKLNDAKNQLAETKQAQSQYHAIYQQQQEMFSEYAQWQRAQSTENAGDKYNNLFSGLKTAKSDFDKGLIGTDDFKTYAKMLSPSGSTDPENFAENYGKAARYITEDESGLVHFFEDLSHKTDEAGNQMAKFNDQTQQWELNVHDLGEVAQKLGTGETVVEALFGRAEDYGATSTVISDQEDGILKTTEAIQNKAEAQARLNQMEEANKQAQAEGKDNIYNTTAIEAARQEVEKYQAQIDGLKESMEYLSEHSGTDNQAKEAKTATDEIKQMKQEYDSLMEEANGNTESTAYKTAQQLKDSIQQKANESNLELDAELNVTGVKASAQEGLQKAQESGQISSDINLDYDKSSMSLDQLNSKIQELNNEKVRIQTEADTSGSEETLNQLDTEISALQNQKVQVEIDTALNNGNTVDELLAMSDEKLMTTVGCDASEVETVRSELQSMQGEAINMSVKMDSTQFASLINAITGETVEVPVEANTDGAVQETTSAIEGSNPKVTPEVDTSNVESQTQSAVQNATQGAKVEIPSVDIVGHVTEITAGQGLQDVAIKGNVVQISGNPSQPVDVKGNITDVTGSPSGQVNVHGNVVNVSGSPSGTVDVKGNVTSVSGNPSGTVNVKGNITTGKVEKANGTVSNGTINYKKGSVEKADGTTSQGIINYKKGDVEKADGTVSTGVINYNLGNVATPTGMVATGVINYTLGTVAKPKASGTMISPARASGTAYNVLNTQRISSAYADGKVGLRQNETALLNEVGTESIVRDGVWSLIPGGAHLANLKKGDIIFSASQTEALLKNGSISGHARAYASGTVGDIENLDLSSAYAVGGLSLKFNGGLKSSKYGNSGGGSTNTTPTYSSGRNNNSGNGNTRDTTPKSSSKQKHSEQIFDWVNRALTKFKNAVESAANKINDYVSSAFKTKQLNKQISALENEINANKKGQKAYMKKANSVASKYTYYYTPEGSDTEKSMNITIPEKYKKLVREGKWNIQDMNTSTDYNKGLAEAIQKYQDYYDKATDCSQAVQELYNEQLKVFEQWANMPTEEAEKKIDRLTNKLNGIKAASTTTSTGMSGTKALVSQILSDSGIPSAEAKLAVAKITQASTKKKYAKANKKYVSVTKETNDDKKTMKKNGKSVISVAKKAKVSTKKRKEIQKAVKNNKAINIKGLTGNTLKAAKQYNSSRKVYNQDVKKQTVAKKKKVSANKVYKEAKKNVKTQQTNLTKAKKSLTSTQKSILKNQNSKYDYVAQNSLLDQQLAESKQENSARQTALKKANKNVDTYNKNVKSRKSKASSLLKSKKLSKAQKKAIKAGKTIDTSKITNKKLKKKVASYNALVKKTNSKRGTILKDAQSKAQSNADQSQAELAAMKVTNEQEKFKNIQNYYSDKSTLYKGYTEAHQKKHEKSEAHGNYTSSKKYTTQITDLNKERSIQAEAAKKLQAQLDSSVKKGIIKKGSVEWMELISQIYDAKNAVSDLDNEIEQAKQEQITTVYEEMFDRAIEKADRLKDKIGSINDLITEDMMIDKDTGNLTEMGALSITMNSQQLDTELNNLQTYIKKRQQIINDFANGSNKSKYGEKTYDELLAENDSAMQSSLKNANSYREAIINIVTSQAKAVQDAMFKEIDAYKKAKKKQKEYYDYDKTISKKTDEIELIKQQIRALEGLTDAESKAQKAKLEASLKDKQDDLDDTVRDHVYDITVNGLDDLETQLSEDFEKWSNQLSSDLESMSGAISDAISGAGENYSDMMAGIDYILNNIGGITSGQYFTNQDKSNMKKSNSLNTGHLKGYANGTKHVGSNRIAMTNENGREIIVTKDGWITPLEASDMVIPNDITETLIDMAERQQNYAMNGNFKMPELKVKDASGSNVNNVYNTFTVQGDLTRDTLPELNKILDLASSKTQNDIRKNKRRFG